VQKKHPDHGRKSIPVRGYFPAAFQDPSINSIFFWMVELQITLWEFDYFQLLD